MRSTRFKPVWGLLLILIGLGLLIAISRWRTPHEVVAWRTDFSAARAEGASTGKPVLLYLTASWCGPCQSLKRTLWTDRSVESAMRAYVPVEVDVDQHPEVARRYLMTSANLDGGIPAFRVLDKQGDIRRELVGAVSSEQFIQWLKAGR